MWRSALLGAVLLAGCRGEPPQARAAGSWPGQFVSESSASSGNGEAMKGQLQLYVTGDKFQLQMQTKHQEFTIRGKWTAAKSRVTMSADTFEFENPSEEDQKAYQLRIIAPDEIRTAFGHPMVLDESSDRRRLTGLTMSIGPLIGRFEFTRPIPH